MLKAACPSTTSSHCGAPGAILGAPNRKDAYYWEVHAYWHPGIRYQHRVTPAVAKSLIARLVDITRDHVEKQYGWFWTSQDDAMTGRGTARHEGFVHFHDRLLTGEFPSVKMLGWENRHLTRHAYCGILRT
jgi:hypothetical protein